MGLLVGLLTIAAWAVSVSGFTAIVVWVVGRGLAKWNRSAAILVCGAAVPVAALVASWASTFSTLSLSDGSADLLVDLASLGVLAAISFPTSWLLLRSRPAK